MKIAILSATVLVAASAFSPAFVGRRSSLSSLEALVREFDVGSRKVKVFDGDYAEAVVDTVIDAAKATIAAKGSFSLAIPGGSVVAALVRKDWCKSNSFH